MTIAREARRNSVLALLRNASGPLTVDEIAARVAVSNRTVHSDLAELRRRGHVIEGRTARGGGLVLKSEASPRATTLGPRSPRQPLLEEPPSAGYVGYATQLGALKAGLLRAGGGHGGVFLLTGEAGMGKSRMLAELQAAAHRESFDVGRGVASRHEGAPPYWPWTQVLRQQVPRLRDVLTPGLARTLSVLPGALDESSSDELEPAERHAEYSSTGRFALMDAVITLIVEAARANPLVVLLDDLQWADDGTVSLWEFLASRLGESRCLLVGAARPAADRSEQAITERLEVATNRTGGHLVVLDGLSEPEEHELARRSIGEPLTREFLSQLRALTGGNPLFSSELLRGSAVWSPGAPHRWKFPVSATVRSIYSERLSRLSDSAVGVLQDCAILGVRFSLGQLYAIAQDTGAGLIGEAIDACVSERLLANPGDVPGEMSFTHPIAREVVYDGIPPARRTERHLHVFESLRRHFGDQAENHASVLAHHLQMSGGRAPAGSIVRYSGIAGESALSAFAPTEALGHFHAALDHSRAAQANAEVARLWHGLAIAQFEALEASRYSVAMGSLERAFNIYVALGDLESAVKVASHPVPSVTGWQGGMGKFTARALSISASGTVEHGHLLANYGLWAYLDDRDASASIQSLEAAMKIADAKGDRRLKLRALCYSATAYRHMGRAGPDVEAARAAIPLARALEDPWLESQARFISTTAFWWDGDVGRARSEAAESIRLAKRLGNTSRITAALAADSEAALAVADFARVREISKELLTFAEDVRVVRDLADTELLTGDTASGLLMLARHNALDQAAGYVPSGARIAVLACILDPSLELAKLTEPSSWDLRSERGHGALARLAQIGLYASHFAMDRRLASACLERLERPEDRHSWKWMMGSVGLVAHVAGLRDRSEEEFEYATRFFKNAGIVLGLAWTYSERAHALSEGRSSRGRALELLDEAFTLCAQHGIAGLAARLAALRQSLSSGGASYPAGLTRREVEILRLLAAGRTNHEIAKQLVISTNTVVRHIANVFAKTNSTNRAQAASFAVSHGLASSS